MATKAALARSSTVRSLSASQRFKSALMTVSNCLMAALLLIGKGLLNAVKGGNLAR